LTKRIIVSQRVVVHVWIEIYRLIESRRVFGQEPPCVWIEVARPEVMQIRFGVEISGGVAERVHERAGRVGDLAEAVVRVSIRERSRCVAQGSDRAQGISVVITGGAGSEHG